MKSIYFWITALLVSLGMLPAMADNVQFSVNVPNADAVACQVNGEDYPLVRGENKFDVPEYANLYFTGKAPWMLKGVTDKNGSTVGGFYGDSWYLTAFATIQDEVYTLSVVNIDEFRTSSFTINVDDPALVDVMLGGYYTNLTLQPGENVVKYDPAVETYLNINPKTSAPIYEVKMNGATLDRQGTGYTVELEEDCVIDITAILPDEDLTLTFSYSEGGAGAIRVSVDNKPVEDFDGEVLVVKLGSSVTLNGNTAYKINEVTIDGTPVKFDFSYVFTAMKDMEIYVDAQPYGTIKATVVVPDPELVAFFTGYYDSGDNRIPMQAGENELELPENASTISWTFSSNAIRNVVTLNGTPLSDYTDYATLVDGDVLVFDVTEKNYDRAAVVWIDKVKGKYASYYFGFDSQAERFSFSDGYNYFTFYEQMNPFSLSWASASDAAKGKVFLNGEELEPFYEGSTFFQLELVNNDVVKVFLDGAPVDCAVSFDIEEGVDCEIVKDVVCAVEDPAEGFNCFAGTEVRVNGEGLLVTVNGEEVAAEEGADVHVFVVEDSTTTVKVAVDPLSGINGISSESVDADVYSVFGVKVGKASGMDALSPGIYIVKGKKVLVK